MPRSPSPETDHGSLIEGNVRPWNSYWVWRNKPTAERGAANEILRNAGVEVLGLVSRAENEDPPDCEGTLDGRWSGVEVAELVDRETLARSIKAVTERAAGHEPELPEAYFVWNRDTLIDAIQDLIDSKDAAKLKGGPYERYVLVIHSNEFFLSRIAVTEFLRGAKFRAQQLITDVIIGLSYEPEFGIPTFRLDLTGRARSGK
jgi:hypothetical protein